MIRTLTSFEEKQATRWLYEQAFEDPEAFVDYYYGVKCSDNKMVVKEDADGKLLSMLHLNPYSLYVCGATVASYYVVAVATDKDHRHEGHMTDILDAAFSLLREEGVPFVFLLPVDPAIYTGFGFETVCKFRLREERLPYESVKSEFDVYCIHDERYMEREEAENRLAGEGASEVLPADPVMMVKVTNEDAFRALPGAASLRTEQEMCAWLRDKKLYFTEEV